MELRHYLKLRFGLPISFLCVAASVTIVSGQSEKAGSEPNSHNAFPCLAKDIGLEDVVQFSQNDKPNITVKDKLIELKARCRKGKLLDAKRREIRFFRPQCWGNPPADRLEIEKRQREELAELKKKYTVIEMSCNLLKVL